MTIETFITAYGYPALITGCILEGGTVAFVSGALAHNGFLFLPWIIAITFCCAFSADQFFFQVGKRKGKGLLDKWPILQPRIAKVQRAMVTYQLYAIMGFRFIFGMRTIAPIVFGASGVTTRSFFLINLCSNLLWSTTVACSGYFFGHLIETVLDDVSHYKLTIFLGITAMGLAIWLYRHITK